jgi:hypothetical protein
MRHVLNVIEQERGNCFCPKKRARKRSYLKQKNGAIVIFIILIIRALKAVLSANRFE